MPKPYENDQPEEAAERALDELKVLLEDRLVEVKTEKGKTVTAVQIGQEARARLKSEGA